tara:strand:- start:4708 stop:4842 length:135 start_codon:yes stop_codon:yes gene_type:complete
LKEIRERMSLQELLGWSAYFSLKAEEEEKAYKDAQVKARTKGMR